ncbi:hypothetical protein AB5N19_03147 [Seiridium cardinale]
MSQSGNTKSWATNEDWEKYKPVISYLYIGCDQRLEDVSATMSKEYRFYATTKMYKFRFRQWGVRKNLKFNELRDILHDAGNTTALDVPVIQGQRLERRLRAFIGRSRRGQDPNDEDWVVDTLGRAYHARFRYQPNPPDNLLTIERSLRAVQDHANIRLSDRPRANVIYNQAFTCDETRFWWINTFLAALRLEQETDLTLGFDMLNRCCNALKSLLHTKRSILTWYLYAAMVALSALKEEIALSFMDFAVSLSSITLGPLHPITTFAANLRKLGIEKARQAAAPLATALADVIRNPVAGKGYLQLASSLFGYNHCPATKMSDYLFWVVQLLPCSAARISLDAEEVSSQYWVFLGSFLASRFAPASVSRVATEEELYPKYEKVRSQLDQYINERIRQTKRPLSEFDLDVNTLRIMAYVDDHIKHIQTPKHYRRRALELALSRKPIDGLQVLSTYAELEFHHRTNQELDEARRVGQEYDALLRQFHEDGP